MTKVEEIKAEIETLPPEAVSELAHWLAEKEAERWDEQIESDAREGRLDFLVREALDEKAKGTLKEI